jgi:hypothetical protein
MIVGPWAGKLDNGGETIRLFRPDEPLLDLSVPQILTDRVGYDDDPPWPAQPDGQGFSLERIVATEYGNDPVNWNESPGGGTPGQPNASKSAAYISWLYLE